MRSQGPLAPTEQTSDTVALTIYARPGILVCSRILQILEVRGITVERIVVDFGPCDHGELRGLDLGAGPVMRLSVVASLDGEREIERLTSFLNRVIDVYQVVAPSVSDDRPTHLTAEGT